MKTQNPQQKPATSEEVWRILREMAEERRREVAERRKADEKLKKQQEETARQMKETDKAFKKLYAQFNSQWSKLVESLVEGKLVELLRARDIDVNETYTRVQRSYTDEKGKLQSREIDIIAANGKEVVAVEVKTTLKPDDVKYFLETLKIFKRYFSLYADKPVYGAVAFLRSDAKAPVFAERQGLFVIRATGDSASLINKPSFKPKTF